MILNFPLNDVLNYFSEEIEKKKTQSIERRVEALKEYFVSKINSCPSSISTNEFKKEMLNFVQNLN